MKKFKKIQAFEGAKLTKEQMNRTTGGLISRGTLGCTCGTYSVCDSDGTTDGDCGFTF
jgi:natural product precursor